MSDEGRKATWDGAAYIMDPYLGLAHAQGADARKTGEDTRYAPGPTDATLIPKRSRKASRPTTCQVDGCGRDLSGEKAYLQRYSVCDMHFKADMAVVHGLEMRFCQQCNKFQDLREFEGVRRSCAARSKDRNLRRRMQTTLQKGGTAEEALMFSAVAANVKTQHRQHRQQQSGSPGRSGGQAGGGTGGSDDSGGRTAGSGDMSMGGSAAMERRPGGGSGGSDDSLEAAGAGGLVKAAGTRRVAQPPLGGAVQCRNAVVSVGLKLLEPQQQPTGSGGNGGGTSSGNPNAGGQDAAGGGAGPWLSMEQMGQSYDADGGLPPSLTARRGVAVGGGGGDGSMLMDLDGLLPGSSSHPYALAHGGRHQQAAGHTAAVLSLDAGGGGSTAAASQREQDASYIRKMGGGGGGGGSCWGGPSSLSLLDAFESIRPAQQHQQAASLNLQQQQQGHQAGLSRLALHQGAVQSGTPSGSLLGGTWGSGTGHRQHSSIGDGSGLGAQQQVTLGGSGEDGSAAALLEQLQGAMAAGMGPRGAMAAAAAAARDEASLASLLGQGGPHGGGGGGALGGALRSDKLEGSRAASAGYSGQVLMLQHHQQAAGALPSLMSGPAGQRQDDLTAMIKERRAALIRQQLMQQQHRQHQQQAHEPLLPQEQLAHLGPSFSEGPSMGLTATEQQHLRLLAAGGSANSTIAGSAAAAGMDDYYDVVPAFGVRGGGGAPDGGPGLGSGRLLGARGIGAASSSGGSEALGMMVRRQPCADASLDTLRLLEQYALGGGGGDGGLGRLGGGGGNGAHLGPGAGFGGRRLQQHNTASGGVGGSGDGGGGGFGRYDSGDAGGTGSGGAGFAAHGPSDRGNDAEGGAGGGRSVLSVLFPGAGGREDALAARVCLKLFSCMPEDLPGDMLVRLRRWAVAAESDVMQIFMRPGCVHLIVNVRLKRGSQETLERYVLGGGDLVVAVAALRGAFESSGLLRGRRVVVQAAEGPRGAFEYDGAADGQACWVAEADLARAPSVVAMQPAAMSCGVATVAVLTGRNLLQPGTRYYARCGGRSYELRALASQPATTTMPVWSPPEVPSAKAAEAAPRPCSPTPPTAPEAASGFWTSCGSSSSQHSLCLPGGGCEDLMLPREGSNMLLDTWTSPGSSSHTLDRSRDSAATLLADAGSVELDASPPPPLLGGGAAAATAALVAAHVGPWGVKSLCLEVVYVQMPALPRHGLVAVEAVSSDGDVMGAWTPGLVCQNPAVAAELNAWLGSSTDAASGRWLMKELGVLLDYDAELSLLLHEPLTVSAGGAAVSATASRRGEGPTAAPLGSCLGAADGSAVPGSLTTVRSSSQRAQQNHTHSSQQLQQLQPPPPQRVVPAVSNPLPRHVADHDGMSAAVAAVGAGALSSVLYTSAESAGLPPIVSARPDGCLELRLLQSEILVPAAATAAATAGLGQGRAAATSGAAGAGTAHGRGGVVAAASGGGNAASLAYGAMAAVGPTEGARVTLSDDTKVPDAPGRLQAPSMRRLLAHPLLHPGCRRAMRSGGERLLAFAVASGLECLATGLLEWLMALEAPTMGFASGGVATVPPSDTGLESDPMPGWTAAELFARVASCAAVATVHGGAVGAGMASAPVWSTVPGESYPGDSSSHDSSLYTSSASSGKSKFRNLSNGLSLLHLAVASCSTRMVMQVLEWAEEYGKPWVLDERSWPGSVTALHLAAAVGERRGDRGDAARLLLSLGWEAQEVWLQARDAEGRTPADIASSVGLDALNYFCLHGEEAPSEEAPRPLPTTPAAAPLTEARQDGTFVVVGEGVPEGVHEGVDCVRVEAVACGRCLGAGDSNAGGMRGPAAVGLPLLLGALLAVLVAVVLRELHALKAPGSSFIGSLV